MQLGAIDTETVEYLRDSARFSDVFNFWLYQGRQIIKPDELKELDTTEIALPYGSKGKVPTKKYRDLLKLYAAMSDNQAVYVILGIESQTETHYAMPIKNMLYDAMNYTRQVSMIAKAHRDEGTKMSGGEFLSGFCKDDKLMPVITLTVSFNSEEWDGPLSLHDMLAVQNKELLAYVPNYKINLLTPAQIDETDFDKFRTDIGTVIQCIKHKRDEDMSWMTGKDKFKHINRTTANLIKTVTGFDMEFEEEGDVVDMSNAWENGLKKAQKDAKRDGINEGRGIGHNDAIVAIRMLRENKSVDFIREQTGLTDQNISELRAML